jgi:hypothetical protein
MPTHRQSSSPLQDTGRIDDAVPLFHHTTMNPLMETAFLLVRARASRLFCG